MPIVLEMNHISKVYEDSGKPLRILSDVSLKALSGDAIAIRGPSGCGKTTLLHIAGTLDRPTSGILQILGENPWTLQAGRLAEFRNQHIGFIFQEHQLLPQCSVIENVLLPALAGFPFDGSPRTRALDLIDRVGLRDRVHHLPSRLSGGERQRVAVCRALLNRPSLLLADEPTGNLDPETGAEVGQLLLEVAAENDTALLCVTHSDALASRFPSVINIAQGSMMSVAAES